MMLDLISKFDHFSGSNFLMSSVYWILTLSTLIMFLNGSTYWMTMGRGEAFVLSLLLFDPANFRESRAFSDPGYSVLVCSAWLMVGYTGLLSLFPYYNDLAREPAFIYSVTMVLWWYALLSYGISSFRQFWYGLFLNSKSATYFILLFFLEAVSWVSRGLTFGARFLASSMFGTAVSYALAGRLSVDVDLEGPANKNDLSGGLNIAVKDSALNAKEFVEGNSLFSYKSPSSEGLDWWFSGLHYDLFPMMKWQYSWSEHTMSQVFIEMLSALGSASKQLFYYPLHNLISGSGVMLLVLIVAWNFYEIVMVVFQCYLIGLLGICFCVVEPMSYSDGTASVKELVLRKRINKVSMMRKLWEKSL
uniref:ATP synthase F0 subunit 6 n=1 Tax=Tridacna squamosa TaxID=80830 RepID=A0A0U1YXU2_TRISQ|nr:ATP synthase F0 subunit 6 [Tridacna squamosa]AJK90886.1 ATP synthase F0 subunit 6 [Tridacna squamosa]